MPGWAMRCPRGESEVSVAAVGRPAGRRGDGRGAGDPF